MPLTGGFRCMLGGGLCTTLQFQDAGRELAIAGKRQAVVPLCTDTALQGSVQPG